MAEYAAPIPFIQNENRFWNLRSDYVAITAINAVFDVINYFVFVVIHLIVEIVLFNKLIRTIREKEEKMK